MIVKKERTADIWKFTVEPQMMDDIRALGHNSADDDRAFAAIARLFSAAAVVIYAETLVRDPTILMSDVAG